jgi:hypothetical protein
MRGVSVCRLGLALAVFLSGCAHGGGRSVLPQGSGPGAAGQVRTPRSIGPIVQTAAGANTAYNNTASVTLAAAPRAGDLLLVGVSWGYDPASPVVPVTPPAGWTLVKRVDHNPEIAFAVYSRIATGTEGTTLTWNVGNAGDQYSIALSAKELSGVDTAKPVDVVATKTLETTRSMSLSATPARAGDLGVAYFVQYYETSNPAPTGFTAASGWTINDQQHGANSIIMAQSQTQNAVNAGTSPVTASESWSNGENSSQLGVLVLVEPPAGAGNGTITLVQGAQAASGSGGSDSISVSLPAAPASGDVLLAAVQWADSPAETYKTIQPPTGWSRVDSANSTNYDGVAVFAKAVQSGDPAGPYTFMTPNNYHAFVATLDEVNGADVVRPANVWRGATQNSGYSQSISTGPNPTVSNGLVIAYFDQYNGGANPTGFTPGSGYVLRAAAFDSMKEVAAQELVGTTGTTAGSPVTASESWTGGENSSMAAEIVVLAPKPPVVGSGGPTCQGCPVLPPDNPINTDISAYPVDPNSANYINEIMSTPPGQPARITYLWPQFGDGGSYGPQGQPINVVNEQPSQYVDVNYAPSFGDGPYDYNSDRGYFPIPANAAVEQQSYYTMSPPVYSDHHMIVLDAANCGLYEFEGITQPLQAPWNVNGSAVYDLRSDALRPEGWGSVDAAGMPMMPLLVRGDEVQAGAVNHAMRFHVDYSSAGHIHPAIHDAAVPDPSGSQWAPPMGARLRLKASFDFTRLNGYPVSQIIARGLQKYGMFVADNGANGGLSGDTSSYWMNATVNNDINAGLGQIRYSDFEVVQTGSIIHGSSAARSTMQRRSAVRH